MNHTPLPPAVRIERSLARIRKLLEEHVDLKVHCVELDPDTKEPVGDSWVETRRHGTVCGGYCDDLRRIEEMLTGESVL